MNHVKSSELPAAPKAVNATSIDMAIATNPTATIGTSNATRNGNFRSSH